MAYRQSRIVTKAANIAKNNLWNQQFGQSNDGSAWDGKVACTHTCWQFIILVWRNKRYTIDQISKFAGYPYRAKNPVTGDMRGFNLEEQKRLIDQLNLPYVLKLSKPWNDIYDYLKRGPVLYGVRYGSEPDWRGYRYMGVKADGKPNGFAISKGRTQLIGYENGAHAVVTVGPRQLLDVSGDVVRKELLRKDPNHHSGSRPEKPPFHVIKMAQAKEEYDSYHDILGRSTFAFVPTKSLPV